MSLLLYGIAAVTKLAPYPEQPLVLIRAAGLAAVASLQEHVDQDVESVLAFGKVVEHIDRQTTVVPMRYGNLLADDLAVTQHLIGRADGYRARLEELEGCTEMGVRFPLELPPLVPSGKKTARSGYEFMLTLKQKYSATEQAEQEAAAVDLAVAGLYRKRCGESSLLAGHPTYLLSYLVPRTYLSDFRARLENMEDIGSQHRLITGPWPPYHFAAL